MEKETKTKYILSEEEAKLVKECLNYCWHRITAHNKFNVDLEDKINELRRSFNH